MPAYPPLPVPQKLREFLADYPECIAEIADELAHYSSKPSPLQPYDGALWAIEGAIERMAMEAAELAEQARERGDLAAAEAAEAKDLRLLHSRSFASGGELSEFIRQNWGITP
jgi:hypothetical protein